MEIASVWLDEDLVKLLDYLSGEIDHSLTMAAMTGVLQAWMSGHYGMLKVVFWLGPNPFVAYYLPRKLQQVDEAQHRTEKNRNRKHHSIMFPPRTIGMIGLSRTTRRLVTRRILLI